MAGPLSQAGAISDPSRFAALSMAGEEFTGMWTQAGPYRDAASAYLTRKFYSGSRFDRIIDGVNREITSLLTDGRRPGTVLFNNNPFGPVSSFFSFKFVQNGSEIVKLIVDTPTAVYDGSDAGKVLIYTKPAGAGKTRFLNIGPILYMGNGKTQKKWVQSSYAWKPLSSDFADGTKYIVDPNGNIQKAIAAQTVNISQIDVEPGPSIPGFKRATFLIDPSTPLAGLSKINLTMAGLTTRPLINGGPYLAVAPESVLQFHLFVALANVNTGGFVAETGTASTGAGVTGNVTPTWATTVGDVTQDGSQQWTCMGPSLQNWGGDAPANIPAVTQAPFPSTAPAWAANTWYSPLMVIVDSGTYYQLTTDGQTGGAPPAFNPALGATTNDGTAVWTSLGTAPWTASTAYAAGDVVVNFYTYSTTVTTYQYDYNTHTLTPITTVQQVTVTSVFLCVVGGVSGTAVPSWNNGLGTTTNDGTVAWQNMGSSIPGRAAIGNAQLIVKESQVTGGGCLQSVQQLGKTGGTEPNWSTELGGVTAEPSYPFMWKNVQVLAPGTPGGAWIYAYSGLNSITREITTASQPSAPITVAPGNAPVITGVGLADSQFDQLILWRSTQGESTLIYDDVIPNPGAGQTFIYTDTHSDKQLNALEAAPVDHANDPPPDGATIPAFYLSRIWIGVDNVLQYSQSQGSTQGSAFSAFAPANNLTFQGTVLKYRPITVQGGALLVYTTSGIFIVLGSGTASDPYFAKQYADKINLLSYDTEDIYGSQVFLMESNFKVASFQVEYPFNPQSGYTEIGYPIGDQFLDVNTGEGPWASGNLYQAFTPFLSWNPNCTSDTALYAADGGAGWFRMSLVGPPEQGILWSPRAAILGGTSAVREHSHPAARESANRLLLHGLQQRSPDRISRVGCEGCEPAQHHGRSFRGRAHRSEKPRSRSQACYLRPARRDQSDRQQSVGCARDYRRRSRAHTAERKRLFKPIRPAAEWSASTERFDSHAI